MNASQLLTMPRVSVIIPTFNRAKHITHAIDSVISQSYRDLEIIVIDDGSTDNTRDVLDRYKTKIKYLYQKKSGVSTARNYGIRQAQGEWIAFLDSDDEWMPEYLSLQMDRVEQNPKVCAHITNSIQLMDNDHEINTFRKLRCNFINKFGNKMFLEIERPLFTVIKHHITSLQSTIIKRKVFIEAGLFNENLTIAEDFDAIARMSLHGPMEICKKPLVYIIRRRESIDNLTNQMYSVSGMNCFAFVYNRLREDNRLLFKEKRIINKYLSCNRRAVANIYLKNGETKKAKSKYKESFFIYPSAKSLLKYIISYLPMEMAASFVLKNR